MRWFVVAVLLSCAGTCACTRGDWRADWRAEVTAWKSPAPLPRDLPLVDQRGRAFRLGDLAGTPTALGFVFTGCAVADACPMTMSRLVEADRLAREQHVPLRVVAVTIDPAHDTPAALAQYGARFHADDDVTIATGEPDAVAALASLFNVVAVARGGTLVHPVKTALLDDKLAPVRQWTDNNFLPKEMVDAAAPQ